MATPTATTPAPDWEKATKQFTAIKEKVMSYAGKAGMNPFMWWDANGAALEKRLADGPKTQELYNDLLKFSFAEPKAPELGVKTRKPTPKPSV